MFYWIMKHIVIGPILLAIFRPWVVGLEHVPKEGAVVLASNHLSFIDSIFLPLIVDRPVVFLAKSGRKIESMNERWLLASTTAPCFGTCSRPTTHGRKIARRIGPTTMCFMIQ